MVSALKFSPITTKILNEKKQLQELDQITKITQREKLQLSNKKNDHQIRCTRSKATK